MVEFISYNGDYPNLCSGKLVLKINGEIVEFSGCDRFWTSGGGCDFFDDSVTCQPWELTEVPAEFEEYKEEMIKVFNENVPYGCCGGCI